MCRLFFCKDTWRKSLDVWLQLLYYVYNNEYNTKKDGEFMIVKIDFESEEAIYIQLRNQIIIGIATDKIREGDSLPSVRQLADNIGINMHTVNKAYSVLKQEGFVKLDRRKGAVVSLDIDKIRVLEEIRGEMQVVLARGICKGIDRQEIHDLVDDIYDRYLQQT